MNDHLKPMIGLEIHCLLSTRSKLFCSCPNAQGDPNTHVCPTCLGFPGSKPTVNKKAIEMAMMVAQALNCKVNPSTFFSRKSYFYPDMSKDFQITQFEVPLCVKGHLDIEAPAEKRIRIRRIHLEEDPARLQHVGGTIVNAKYTLIDYNRSGAPLIEIVTDPDFDSPQEARQFLVKLSSILEHLGVFDSSRDGSMRVDGNVSVAGNNRVEIKNISGFKQVERALAFEIIRQRHCIRRNAKIVQETRHFDTKTGITSSLRTKETEADYGYIFEPDLPGIGIPKSARDQIAKQMPELPDARIARMVKKYKLHPRAASVLVYTDKSLADFFETCAKEYKNSRILVNLLQSDVLRCLNWNSISIRDSKLKPEHLLKILKLVDSHKITRRTAKKLLEDIVLSGKDPEKIVQLHSLVQIADKTKLVPIVKQVVKSNPKAKKDFKAGKRQVIHFLAGKVQAKAKGRANSKLVLKLLKQELG